MTNSTRPPEPEMVEHLVVVLRSLIDLLRRFGERPKADWLSTQLAMLDDESASTADIANSMREMHQVVLGMGGLMDLHLEAGSDAETEEVNAELDRLADQLFELTR